MNVLKSFLFDAGFQTMWVNVETQNTKIQSLLREHPPTAAKTTAQSSSEPNQAGPTPWSFKRKLQVDSKTGWSQFAIFSSQQSQDN